MKKKLQRFATDPHSQWAITIINATKTRILLQIHTKGSFVNWLQDKVIPGFYYSKDYLGRPVSKYNQKFISSTYAMRLGPPKLRQLRTKMEECRIPLKMKKSTKLCGNWYKLNSEWIDHSDYIKGWQALRTSNDNMNELDKAFTFQTSAALKSIPFWGFLTTYEGGGYIANLGQNLTFAQGMLRDLKTNSWVDRYTRVVFVELNVLNIQSGLFTQVILSLEFPPVGGVFHWMDLTSVQLYRYAGALGLINIVIELGCVVICFVFAGFAIKDLVTKGCAFAKKPQFITQMLVVICFCVAMSLYAYRSVWTVRQVEYMMRNWGDTVNFQRVVMADRLFLIFLGLATFIIFMQFLGILRYNHTIAMLNTTLTASAGDVASMGLVVVIVLAAFMSCAHLSFGAKMLEYSSIKNTILSLTSSFLGKFDFDDISSTAGFGGRIFLLIYLLTMILIFVNLFITLLCNFMDVVRQDTSVIPKDHEVVDYMLDSFKALVVSDDKEEDQDDCKSRRMERSDSSCSDIQHLRLYRKSFSSE